MRQVAQVLMRGGADADQRKVERTTQSSWAAGPRWEREAPGRPLSGPGERALLALVALCPEAADEASTPAVAAAIGLKTGAAKLALQGLIRRRLAYAYDGDTMWTPTIAGRWRAAELGAAGTAAIAANVAGSGL